MEELPLVEITCCVCFKKSMRKKSAKKCLSCANKWHIPQCNMIDAVCILCEKNFKTYPSSIKICSKKCKDQHKTFERNKKWANTEKKLKDKSHPWKNNYLTDDEIKDNS